MNQQVDAFGGAVEFEVSADDLAEIFGVTRRQVYNYADKGMPLAARGRFDLRQVVQWWAEEIKAPAKSLNEVTARSLLAEAQREKVELETARMRGELLPADEARRIWAAGATAIATLHDGFGARNAAILADMTDPGEVQNYLFVEMRAMRASIAREFKALGEVETEIKTKPKKPASQSKTRKKRNATGSATRKRRANNTATTG